MKTYEFTDPDFESILKVEDFDDYRVGVIEEDGSDAEVQKAPCLSFVTLLQSRTDRVMLPPDEAEKLRDAIDSWLRRVR